MQRSRRALLHRRALEKSIGRNRLYKLSLSFILVLWGLVYLLNLFNSHGEGYRDRDVGESQASSFNTSTWNDALLHSTRFLDSVGAESADYAVDKDTEEARKEIRVRIAHVADLAFDEFKTKETASKSKNVGFSAESVVLRVEPGGAKYNYASSGNGAKVLDFNKECKGGYHILVKDKDKYLRNPCSAEEKFVVVELSEETLVSSVQIANFEHYSSNLNEFEILGSSVYPTDSWVKLGSFFAENVKHAQTFNLLEPKWVRYLKLNFLSHYGSEFYCTLSSFEVYGVDAVEWMLEDLIEHEDESRGALPEPVLDLHPETVHDVSDAVEKVNHQQVSRMPGDSVLKILMQKVRALDLNFSVLERYLEELNSRYKSIFKEFDEEMGAKDIVLEKTRLDIKSFFDSKDAIVKDVEDLLSWKSQVSMQLDAIIKDNAILRSEVRKVHEKQTYMESKGIIIFIISMVFIMIALIMLCTNTVLVILGSEKPRKFCSTHSSSWAFILLSCITIIIILSL